MRRGGQRGHGQRHRRASRWPSPPPAKRRRLSRCRPLAMLAAGEANVAAIARQLKVERRKLYRSPAFKRALKATRGEAENHKDARRGKLAGDRDFTRDD